MSKGLLDVVTDAYDVLWKAIIRPPRENYDERELGPPAFQLYGKVYRRTDFEVVNMRGHTLKCSHFEPDNRLLPRLPCVIYLHGNASSRVEGIECLTVLLPLNITVVSLDFSGSGHSGGEYVSLGWFEKDDLSEVIDYLRERRSASTLALWGRSMGAVTAILHASRDPTIAGIVCDSAFSRLRSLCEELVGEFTSLKPPRMIINLALNIIRNTIQQKAHFDIDDVAPIDYVDKIYLPSLFISAKEDQLVNPRHTKLLINKYAGDVIWLEVEGDHNSARDRKTMAQIGAFFFSCLQCTVLFGNNCPKPKISLPQIYQPRSYSSRTSSVQPDETQQIAAVPTSHTVTTFTTTDATTIAPPTASSQTASSPDSEADVAEENDDESRKEKDADASRGKNAIMQMVPPERPNVFKEEELQIENGS